jgi:hypothetical protein
VREGSFPGLRMDKTIAFIQEEKSVFSFHILLYMDRKKPLAAGDR